MTYWRHKIRRARRIDGNMFNNSPPAERVVQFLDDNDVDEAKRQELETYFHSGTPAFHGRNETHFPYDAVISDEDNEYYLVELDPPLPRWVD